MTPRPNSSLEDTDPEPSHIVEDLVPTPIFSGQARFKAPSAISFASATAEFATPPIQGTLMVDFAAEHRVLRDWDDTFETGSFTQLVITVCTNAPDPLLFHSSIRSGQVSKWSGRPQWRASLGVGITSLAQSWRGL